MVGNEIYSLISLFPYETRYALYGEWKAKMTSIPVLEVIATGRLLDAKWILKRLSKENALENGRKLAKLIHANPTIILPAIIEMLQNYPNQIDMIITASKYFTELDYDVFSFSVIDALSSKLNKPRIDETGTAYTKWFLALSNLCGSLWTRYDVSHEGLLSYIIKQLINDSIHDLLILENLISQMTGQTITGEFTVAQRDALSGGPALRRELSMDETVISKQSTTRFIEELNDGFAFPLGILIAQHRRQIVHLERVDELKILGWEFDKVFSLLI